MLGVADSRSIELFSDMEHGQHTQKHSIEAIARDLPILSNS